MTDPSGLSAPADQADRDLISRDGLDRTLFVEAGAGTGKTTQLVQRITSLVLAEGVVLAEIAAITFTEAAATELQARIRAQFERGASGSGDSLERERCLAALADLDRAAIGTVHGFASRVLGEFAVAAGLPPQVRVLDEVSSQLAAEQRWQRFVDGLYEDPDHEELLVRSALLGIDLEPGFPGASSLRDVAAQLNQNWDLLADLLAQPALPPLSPVDFGGFDAAVAALADSMGHCKQETDKLLRKVLDEVLPAARAALDLTPDRKLALLASHPKRFPGRFSVGTKGNWPDVSEARALAAAVGEARNQLVGRANDEVLRHLLVLVARSVLQGAEARRDSGGLEFHDLLVLARSLLRSNDEARSALHRRYRYLLLDEFQDTDPIQIDLAVLVATTVQHPAATHWAELAVEPGRLFFVGDPKQSIYRFRRADIALFLQARQHYGQAAAGGGSARLSSNFRSVKPVVGWINAMFGSAMAQEVPGAQPAYEPLHAHRQADSGADHRPLLLGGVHETGCLAAEVRRREAADVARVLSDIAQRPQAWPVYDRRVEAWRPARLDDVTILLPTRTSLPFLREALDGAEVPYQLATGTLVYDTQEVSDVLAVLRAVADPGDKISLVAALRSALYACSDVDLFRYYEAGGRWDLRREAPAGLAGDHPVVAALDHLRGLWSQRWWLGPSAMVDQVLRDRHAFLLAYATPRPADVWRRLRFLAEQSRAFEEAGGGDLRAFLDWAALQGADGARVHEPLLAETDEAAVRIMTIHGAKGLEFPITVLSGMSTRDQQPRIGVSVLWHDGTAELKLKGDQATRYHQPRADLELEMDRHEKLRLLYVAVTRARDHLVVSCHHQPKYSSYAARVWAFAEGAADAPSRRIPGQPDPLDPTHSPPVHTGESGTGESGRAQVLSTLEVVPETPVPQGPTSVAFANARTERERWLATRQALLAPHRAPRTIAATAVAATDVGEEMAAMDAVDGESSSVAGGFGFGPSGGSVVAGGGWPRQPEGPRRGRVGAAVGRAVHATLQLLDLAKPSAVAELVRQQCGVEAISDRATTVEQLVFSALRSEAVGLAVTHRHHKELYVAAPIGDRLLEGYVDLLVETPAGLVIIDYKTDTANSDAEIEAKLATYSLQAAAYAVALEAVTAQPVLACRFVFCRVGPAIERRVGDLPAAMARVRAALAGPVLGSGG